jgi:hypothetical protein
VNANIGDFILEITNYVFLVNKLNSS